MAATYGMMNVTIEEKVIDWSGRKSYFVYADTKRFGKHEIMAQLPTRKEAEQWCKANGVELEQETAEEMLQREINIHGKVQIGNRMFRLLHMDGDKIMGHSNSDGWEALNRYFEKAKAVKKGIAKTAIMTYCGREKTYTIKFGNACIW